MKRVKRAGKEKNKHPAVRRQKKRKPYVKKSAHKTSRRIFVQRELFEQIPAKEKERTFSKTNFWIYVLSIIIIMILILMLIRYIPGLNALLKVKKISSGTPSVTAVVTQQVIQEKAEAEKIETSIKKQENNTIIYFGSNKWDVQELYAKEKNKLNTLIEDLLNAKSLQGLFVYGYADRTGLRSYNLVVSEKRARNIAEFLSEKTGLTLDKIIIQGKGEILEGPDGVNNPLFRKVEVIKR